MSPEAADNFTLAVVTAYINASGAAMTPTQIADLARAVHAVASGLGAPVVEPLPRVAPYTTITRSLTKDAIICLHCGFSGKSLKRHINTAHGQTPEEYRKYWQLRPDYPMVAPSYSERRSELAKASGLGRKD